MIPEGDYGAGEVKIAETGTYEPLAWDRDRVEVVLHGARFTGKYVILRFKKSGEKEWLILRAKSV